MTKNRSLGLRGRPTKLTPQVQLGFVRSLERGFFVEDACAVAGVAPATFYGWLARGETGEQPFLDFLDAVRAAEARPRVETMDMIQKQILGDPRRGRPADPQLAMRYLQRRWPRQFQAAPEPVIAPERHDQDRVGMIVRFADPERRAAIRQVLDGLAAAESWSFVDEHGDQQH